MRVKSEAKRQLIIDIAKKAFIELGYSNTSMSEIASRVGGSKATLYNYFSSKEEIFAAVMETAASEQIHKAFQILEQEQDLEATLVNFGVNYLNSVLSTTLMSIWKMAITEAGLSDIGYQFYENGPKRGWSELSDYLKTKMNTGHLMQTDSMTCALHLKALIESELFLPVALHAIPFPEQAQIEMTVSHAVRVFLRAYHPAV